MIVQIPRNIKLSLTVIVVAVILLWSAVSGMGTGKRIAQNELVLKNASALEMGLGYFFQDQDRYPTVLEFQNEALMGSYLFPYPPQEFPSRSCASSYIYRRASPLEFQMLYCLDKAVAGQSAGWHKLEGRR